MEMEVPANNYNQESGEDNCFLCGKRIVGARHFYVHLLTSYRLTSAVDHPLTQGFFPIGPNCRQKLPALFVHKWDD